MTQTVGVIGAGQLAQMLAIASKCLDLKLVVQADRADDVAIAYADHAIIGRERSHFQQLALNCQCITFEHEFIDLDLLQQIQKELQAEFIPSLPVMAILVDKLHQRQFLHQQDIPVPQFVAVDNLSGLAAAGHKLGFPCVIKARRNGYDGKGTWIAGDSLELNSAWQSMGAVPCVVEAYIPYVKELALIAGKSRDGKQVIYPLVETIQKQQVCQRVIAPAPVCDAVAQQAITIAQQILQSLDSAGLMGIEFFLTAAGQVLVNEIAPRTHNSGHYTIDACNASQFAQLLRITADLPMVVPQMTTPYAVMVNLLGYENREYDYAKARSQIANLPSTHLHWYHKTFARIGRKLGHATVLGSSLDQVLAIAESVHQLWYEPCFNP